MMMGRAAEATRMRGASSLSRSSIINQVNPSEVRTQARVPNTVQRPTLDKPGIAMVLKSGIANNSVKKRQW